jgi:hypothetical protein
VLLDTAVPEEPELASEFSFQENAWFQLSEIKYLKGVGIWLPLGAYGTLYVPDTEVPDEPGGIARIPIFALSAETEDGWTSLQNDTFALTSVDADDEVGRLESRRWLFRPTGFVALDDAAADAGDGWCDSAWLGRFHERDYPWVYHEEHGWLYPVGRGNANFYFFDWSLGWLWTAEETYPYLYRYSDASWLYYLEGTGSTGVRWFYNCNPAVNDWEWDLRG